MRQSNAEQNETYDRYVSTHIEHRKGRLDHQKLILKASSWKKVYLPHLPKSKTAKILDIGCGDGALVWWMQDEGYNNAEGVDISREQIELGLSLGIKNLRHQDIADFLDESNSEKFDFIVMRDVLEHLPKETIMTVLEQIHTKLNHGGKLMIQVPNGESPFFGRIRYGDFTHELAFSRSSLEQILRLRNFSNLKFYPVEPVPKSLKSWMRFILWKLISKMYKLLLFAEIGRTDCIVTQNILSISEKK